MVCTRTLRMLDTTVSKRRCPCNCHSYPDHQTFVMCFTWGCLWKKRLPYLGTTTDPKYYSLALEVGFQIHFEVLVTAYKTFYVFRRWSVWDPFLWIESSKWHILFRTFINCSFSIDTLGDGNTEASSSVILWNSFSMKIQWLPPYLFQKQVNIFYHVFKR